MQHDELMQLAQRQWRDYRACAPGTYFAESGALPLDVMDAYAVQRTVADTRVAAGDAIAGYKVGCTGPGTMSQFGMAGPIRGYLFSSELRPTGVELDPGAFASLAIEGEMAIRIGESGEITAMFPVIELHNFVFRGGRKTLVELIVNNGFNAGIVMGSAAPDLDDIVASDSSTLSVRINGRLVDRSGLWPLPGGAAESLDWLRKDLARDGLSIAPGQIVIVGTPLGLYPVSVGDRIETCIDDVPMVACSVGGAGERAQTGL